MELWQDSIDQIFKELLLKQKIRISPVPVKQLLISLSFLKNDVVSFKGNTEMLNENGDKPEFIVNLENEIHKKAEKYGNRTVYVVNKEDKREFYYIIVNGENKEIEGYTKKYYNDEHDYDITNAHYKDGEITDYWRIFEKPDPKNPGIFIEYRDRYIKDSDGKWEHTTTQRRFKDSGFHVTWLD